MKLISHRGNLSGPSSKENDPRYIDLALGAGFDAEVDLWYVKEVLYLGHDEPQYQIEYSWLRERRDQLWIHCKNLDALFYLKQTNSDCNYFWHQADDVTITSHGFLWTYPGKTLSSFSIAVMPEIQGFDNLNIAAGVCSDRPIDYKHMYY